MTAFILNVCQSSTEFSASIAFKHENRGLSESRRKSVICYPVINFVMRCYRKEITVLWNNPLWTRLILIKWYSVFLLQPNSNACYTTCLYFPHNVYVSCIFSVSVRKSLWYTWGITCVLWVVAVEGKPQWWYVNSLLNPHQSDCTRMSGIMDYSLLTLSMFWYEFVVW